jgi:hypothetical protein
MFMGVDGVEEMGAGDGEEMGETGFREETAGDLGAADATGAGARTRGVGFAGVGEADAGVAAAG